MDGAGPTRTSRRAPGLAPLPLPSRPAYAVLFPAAVGLLPAWVRNDLRLPSVPGLDPLIVRPAARALVRTLAWAIEGAIEADAA